MVWWVIGALQTFLRQYEKFHRHLSSALPPRLVVNSYINNDIDNHIDNHIIIIMLIISWE